MARGPVTVIIYTDCYIEDTGLNLRRSPTSWVNAFTFELSCRWMMVV